MCDTTVPEVDNITISRVIDIVGGYFVHILDVKNVLDLVWSGDPIRREKHVLSNLLAPIWREEPDYDPAVVLIFSDPTSIHNIMTATGAAPSPFPGLPSLPLTGTMAQASFLNFIGFLDALGQASGMTPDNLIDHFPDSKNLIKM